MLDFDRSFRQYGLPLLRVSTQGALHDIERHIFSTTAAAASTYFHQRFAGNPQFNFFALPAELRMTIYKYVFTYSALWVPSPSRKATAVKERGPLIPLSGAHEADIIPPAYHAKDFLPSADCSHVHLLPSIQTLLSLLLVNKQMHHEAFAVSYEVNYIYLHRLSDLNYFAQGLHLSPLAHVRNIIFDFWPEHPTDFRNLDRTFTLLVQAKGLKSVSLRVEDAMWLDRIPAHGFPARIPEDIPKIDELCEFLSTIDHVEIIGSCPQVKTFIDKNLARIAGRKAKETELAGK